MFLSLKSISNNLKLFLLLLTGFVIYIPKVNLISIGAFSGAALRIDDFIILFLFLLIIAIAVNYIVFNKKLYLSRAELYFYAFCSIGFLSLLLNYFSERGSVLYVLRLIQYFTFFYLGYLITNIGLFKKLIFLLVSINVFVMLLQKANILGGFKDGVYIESIGLPPGLTNGSYEIAMVLAISFFIYLSVHRKIDYNTNLLFSIAFLGVFISASRITLFALFIVYFCFFIKKIKEIDIRKLFLFLAIIVVSGLVIVSYGNIKNSDAVQRLSSFFANDSMTLVGKIIDYREGESEGVKGSTITENQFFLKTSNSKGEYLESFADSDLSSVIRFNKWVWAIKTYFNQPVPYWLMGIGPGTLGNALDGGLLRIIIEYGLIGFILFLLFLKSFINSKKKDYWSIPVIVVFVIGNLFIDYYMSYKVMSVFLLGLGTLIRYSENES